MMRVSNNYGKKISTVVNEFITGVNTSKNYKHWLKCEYGNKYCPIQTTGHTRREDAMNRIRLMDYRM